MRTVSKINDYVLYFHLNPTTEDVFYVGIGSAQRALSRYSYQRNRFWVFYVKKYGEPIIKIIKQGLSLKEASELEVFYIKLFGRKAFDSNGALVNISEGGEKTAKGFKHTVEARRKISEALRKRVFSEKTLKRMSDRMKGTKMSDESKLKNSLSHLGKNHPMFGKPRSEITKQKISIANKGNMPSCSRKVINTKTGDIYSTAKMVQRLFFPQMHPCSINSILNGNKSNRTDFQYLDDYESGKQKFVNTNDRCAPKKVIHNITGEVYSSICEAARMNGLSDGMVHVHLKNKIKKTAPLFSYFNLS